MACAVATADAVCVALANDVQAQPQILEALKSLIAVWILGKLSAHASLQET